MPPSTSASSLISAPRDAPASAAAPAPAFASASASAPASDPASAPAHSSTAPSAFVPAPVSVPQPTPQPATEAPRAAAGHQVTATAVPMPAARSPAAAVNGLVEPETPAPHVVAEETPPPAEEKANGTGEGQEQEQSQWQQESTENELLYLSLPANDDPGYYTPTDESSRGSRASSLSRGEQWDYAYATQGREAVDDPPESGLRSTASWDDEQAYRAKRRRLNQDQGLASGNRGNKLRRQEGVRWVRSGKLAAWSEHKVDKEVRLSTWMIRDLPARHTDIWDCKDRGSPACTCCCATAHGHQSPACRRPRTQASGTTERGGVCAVRRP